MFRPLHTVYGHDYLSTLNANPPNAYLVDEMADYCYNTQLRFAEYFLYRLLSAYPLELHVAKKASGYTPVEFHSFQLTKHDKAAFDKWFEANSKHSVKYVSELLEDGYKVSLSPDFANGCVIVTLIGKEGVLHNENKCFSSRADDWEDALGLMLYKHKVLAEGAAWPEDSTAKAWG